MKKILFPITGCEADKYAFGLAAKIAEKMDAELLMLSTFEVKSADALSKDKYKKKIRENILKAHIKTKQIIESYLDKREPDTDEFSLKFGYIFKRGKLIREVFNTLNKEKADLVVFTLSSSKVQNRQLFEFVLKKIFELHPVSILIVPEITNYSEIDKIVYTPDIKNINRRAGIIENLGKLADIFDASLHFLNVTNDKKYKEKNTYQNAHVLNDFLGNNKNHQLNTLYSTNALDTICDYVKSNSIDLVSLTKGRYNFFENLFHESFINRITLEMKIPTLINMGS